MPASFGARTTQRLRPPSPRPSGKESACRRGRSQDDAGGEAGGSTRPESGELEVRFGKRKSRRGKRQGELEDVSGEGTCVWASEGRFLKCGKKSVEKEDTVVEQQCEG